jgi:hypothetical protein
MEERELLTQICDWLKANAYKYGKVRFTEGGLATFDLRTDSMVADIKEVFGK